MPNFLIFYTYEHLTILSFITLGPGYCFNRGAQNLLQRGKGLRSGYSPSGRVNKTYLPGPGFQN